ncbi:MAG: hypothetical protein ACK6DM_11240, partial [Alphaproteobacteria bacterium]
MSELLDLIEAARAAPGSAAITRALLRAAGQAIDPGAATGFLAKTDPTGLDEPTKAMVSSFLLQQGEPEAALLWCQGEAAATRLLRGRIYLILDDHERARTNYEAALAADPSCRSADLDAALLGALGTSAGGTVIPFSPHARHPSAPAPERRAEPAGRPPVSFADIGGLDDVKAQIRRKIILPFEKKSLFDRFRKRAG